MKILKKFLILCLIFSIINCTCAVGEEMDDILDVYGNTSFTDSTANKNNCNNRDLDAQEIEEGAYKCCYFDINCNGTNKDDEYISVYYKGCNIILKEEYKQFDGFIKEYKKGMNCNTFKIQCSGTSISYLGKILYLIFILNLFL